MDQSEFCQCIRQKPAASTHILNLLPVMYFQRLVMMLTKFKTVCAWKHSMCKTLLPSLCWSRCQTVRKNLPGQVQEQPCLAAIMVWMAFSCLHASSRSCQAAEKVIQMFNQHFGRRGISLYPVMVEHTHRGFTWNCHFLKRLQSFGGYMPGTWQAR